MRLVHISPAPAAMMFRIWLLTAVGIAVTAAIAWLAVACGITDGDAVRDPFSLIINFVLITVIAFWVAIRQERFSARTAGCAYLLMVVCIAIGLSGVFPVAAIATVLGISAAMFALSALICRYFSLNPGSGWSLLLMISSGLVTALVVNGILISSTPVWITSIVAVVIWPFTAFYEASNLRGYSRRLYLSDFAKCTMLGALALYFSAVSFFFQLAVMLMRAIFNWWWMWT